MKLKHSLIILIIISSLMLLLINISISNKAVQPNDKLIDVSNSSILIDTSNTNYPQVVNSQEVNDNAAKLIKDRYYNYDDGETQLVFAPLNDTKAKGIMVLGNKNCKAAFHYIFINHLEYFETLPDTYSCFANKIDSIKFYYNLHEHTIEATINGKTMMFSNIRKVVKDELPSIGGEYIVDNIWIQYGSGKWESSPFFEEIKVSLSTTGQLSIISFDFLKEFTAEKAPLRNMDGYNYAEISSSSLVKSFQDNDGFYNYVFNDVLMFHGSQDGYGCEIKYDLMIKDNQIEAVKLHRMGTNIQYLLKFKNN